MSATARSPVADSTSRLSLKDCALALLQGSGAIRLSEWLSKRRLMAITYHRVIPRSAWQRRERPVNTLFEDEFDAQMAFVASRYNVLPGAQLRAVLEGRAAAPDYALAITFDDGYENNYTHALPILRKHGLHAVFFVTSDIVGGNGRMFWFDRLDRLTQSSGTARLLEQLRPLDAQFTGTTGREMRRYFKRLDHARQDALLRQLERHFGLGQPGGAEAALYRAMTWEQVRALAAAGMTIGSHTANHQILSAVPPERACEEITASRQRIEAETGSACWCFGYPNGQREDFRSTDESSLRAVGYSCAFTQIPGAIEAGTPRYQLPRIPIPDIGDLRIFRTHVSGLRRAMSGVLGAQ